MAKTAASFYSDDEGAYHDNNSFDGFVQNMHRRFNSLMAQNGPNLFETHLDIWQIYLDNLPTSVRQYHNCNCCRNFIRRYGHLVMIDDKGKQVSAFWNPLDAPKHYKIVAQALKDAVEHAQITYQFYTDEKQWGNHITGVWHHFAFRPNMILVSNNKLKTPNQLAAEKLEDYRILVDSLRDFDKQTADIALSIIKTDSLYRSEKVKFPIEWFVNLHNDLYRKNATARHRIIWKAVAEAPAGLTHIRSSMIGTLLEDIVNGLDLPTIKKRFADKMNPLQYQRPTAAPTAGNVKQAEEIMQKLGIEKSLNRRYAELNEIHPIWTPKGTTAKPKTSVFSDLVPDKTKPLVVDITAYTNMTWEKFNRTVLPDASKIEVLVPSSGPFSAFLTAADYTAPPIIQWDYQDYRNPLSWYFYVGHPTADRWNLNAGTHVEVTALAYKPNMVGPYADRHTNQGKGVLFALRHCRDLRGVNLCLFPEILKSELHQVRSTIEAHSNRTKVKSPTHDIAAGILTTFDGHKMQVSVRVTTHDGRRQNFHIDRWD